jgi:purine-binding chemotaxis protein CheW
MANIIKKEELTPEQLELLAEIENDPELNGPPEPEIGSKAGNVVKSAAVVKEGSAPASKARPGKYITFTLAGEDYGLHILSVKEIIGMMNITRVPKTPDFVRGVINLRGKVHPVIDLRKRFMLDPKDDDARTPIIIVEVRVNNSSSYLGIVVDTVSEVITVDQSQLEETPTFGVDMDTDFILGLAKVNNKVITLLDIDRILTTRQMVMLNKAG